MERSARLKPIDQLKAEQLAACPNQGIVTDGLVIGEGLKEPSTGRLILEAEALRRAAGRGRVAG